MAVDVAHNGVGVLSVFRAGDQHVALRFRVLLVADQVFSGGADTRVRQHKVDDRSLVRALAGHGDRIYALAAHAPGKRLATGAHNGEVRVWNWETGAGMASFIAVPK